VLGTRRGLQGARDRANRLEFCVLEQRIVNCRVGKSQHVLAKITHIPDILLTEVAHTTEGTYLNRRKIDDVDSRG
jgi:hypothetical protein